MSVDISISSAFDDFQLDIAFSTDCRKIALLGESGSGKSLTLKAISGIVAPEKGHIVIDGKTFFDAEKRVNLSIKDRKVGYLFQNYALFPTMDVRANLMAGMKVRSKEEKYKKVDALIKKYRLEGLENHLPGQLSGGQQQRVAMARMMAADPAVILLDEPFSALDAYLKEKMQQELFAQIADFPGTVIMVTHNRDEAYRFSEELVITDAGRILTCGKTREVFKTPGSKKAARLTGCKNFSRAKRLSDYSFEAIDWGLVMHTTKKLPQAFYHVGYRAHEFVPIWGNAVDNCIKAAIGDSAMLPFERNYYITPQSAEWNQEDMIIWYAQRHLWDELDKKGLPDYLQLLEEHLLIFQESESPD